MAILPHILAGYLLKSVIASGVFYVYYLLALRNKKFHRYNRWYLLAAVVLSLTAPLLNIRITAAGPAPLVVLLHKVGNAGAVTAASPRLAEGWMMVSFSLLISLVLLAVMMARIAWIYRVRKAGKQTRQTGYIFIETDVRQAPFSFFHNLFWREGMPPDDESGRKIFIHELTHIRQRHTYDKLFLQIVLCLFWMNPFFWCIRKELDTLHEFLADAAAVGEGDSVSFAKMLLTVHDGGRYLSLSSSFFHSSIKRRLFMITTSGQTSFARTRRILALGIAILVTGLFSIDLQAQENSRPIDHIEIHGQTDIGDTAIVYFRSGLVKRFFLKNPAENIVFKQNYEQYLPYRPAEASTEYLPLSPIPENISQITFGRQTVWLTLKNGTKEQYDLNNPDEKRAFETKYGKLTVAHHP